jgi:hypothetical protein
MSLNSCMEAAATQTGSRADKASQKAEQLQADARKDSALALQLDADRARLDKQINEIRSSQDSEDKKARAAAALLQRPYQPPKALQKAASAEGIRTNDDLLVKADRKINELTDRVEKNLQQAGTLLADAKKAQAAGTEMNRIGQVQTERLKALSSAEGIPDPASASKKAYAPGSARQAETAKQSELPHRLASARQPDSESTKAARDFLASLDAKILAARKAPGLRASLRARLRQAMMAARSKGDATTERALSAKITELDSQERTDRGEALPEKQDEAVAFSMGETESRKAIEDFLGKLSDGQNREPSSTGAPEGDLTLFQRVSRFFRACESRECVSNIPRP